MHFSRPLKNFSEKQVSVVREPCMRASLVVQSVFKTLARKLWNSEFPGSNTVLLLPILKGS